MQQIEAEQIDQRFAATTARAWPRQGRYALVMLAAAAVILPAWVGGQSGQTTGLLILIPWSILAALLVAGWLAARRQRRSRQNITQAWEMAQLENWADAEQCLDLGMGGPIRSPSDRWQSFMLLATLLERDGRHDLAAHVHVRLLLERIGDGYQLQQTQLALTMAKLRNEELTDAVRLLDQLERLPMPLTLRAVYSLIRLYQQVFMGHHLDAVENMNEQQSLFRRFLSTRAGYGYGLLAASLHHLGRNVEAAKLWLDATTLIRPEKLVEEYPPLASLRGQYPAMEHPI